MSLLALNGAGFFPDHSDIVLGYCFHLLEVLLVDLLEDIRVQSASKLELLIQVLLFQVQHLQVEGIDSFEQALSEVVAEFGLGRSNVLDFKLLQGNLLLQIVDILQSF
jgi:hypothetical protein